MTTGLGMTRLSGRLPPAGSPGMRAPHLPADDVARSIQRFEDRLRKARPDVKYICVEPIPRQP